jgi:ATP-binding cassette, subfamily G (WHITE), member 2, PDR
MRYVSDRFYVGSLTYLVGVIFFQLLFNALLALAELTAAFESRPILLKHKSFLFYRPSAYAIAQTVVDIPLVLIQVLIFNIVVYFMADLQRTASQFFISLLFLFALTMTMYAFFRSLGALLGSLDAATRVTGISIQILVRFILRYTFQMWRVALSPLREPEPGLERI